MKLTAIVSLLPLTLLAANAAEVNVCPCGCKNLSDFGVCNCGCTPASFSFADLSREMADEPVDTLISDYYREFPPRIEEPRVFSGYRSLYIPSFDIPPYQFRMNPKKNAYDRDRYAGILYDVPVDSTDLEEGDEVLYISDYLKEQRRRALQGDSLTRPYIEFDSPETPAVTTPLGTAETPMQAYLEEDDLPDAMPTLPAIPKWLSVAMTAERLRQDMIYRLMAANPKNIQYVYWDLPEPPRLPEEDHSFRGFLNRLDLPAIDTSTAVIPDANVRHINWLHTVGGGLQLSQAYISRNWYQGGNNYLAVLFNFNWNVTLNTVYHPNLLFVSDLSYKLAVNSNPKGSVHDYSISQDQFQYTLKTGLKARDKWFYSLNLLFKTQFFTAYADDSDQLKAKFLSPSEFNAGIGMTYNTKALKNRLSLSVSIAPASYNLKACPSMKIDHAQFNILPERKTRSEFGSNAELNLMWNITDNISWKSRVFLFSNYSYFQADWENTFNFAINRFLSTQLYVYPRFDSSADRNVSKWRYWQLKEILSFGLSYTFSTKP